MTNEEFESFKHESIHLLEAKNLSLNHRFHIGDLKKWHYDLDRGVLTFSSPGTAAVTAAIQVVGSIAQSSHTWMWGWANESLPNLIVGKLRMVRDFGELNQIDALIHANFAATEFTGWELTAVAARIVGGARGISVPARPK